MCFTTSAVCKNIVHPQHVAVIVQINCKLYMIYAHTKIASKVILNVDIQQSTYLVHVIFTKFHMLTVSYHLFVNLSALGTILLMYFRKTQS